MMPIGNFIDNLDSVQVAFSFVSALLLESLFEYY